MISFSFLSPDPPPDNPSLVSMDPPDFLSQLVIHTEHKPFNPLQPSCPTPPDSERTNTPSPFGTYPAPLHGDSQNENIGYGDLFSCAAQPRVDLQAPCRYQPPSLPPNHVGETNFVRHSDRRVQVTFAQQSEACIKILNPRAEYDKVQKKHGHRGKISEQRVAKGKVAPKPFFDTADSRLFF